MQSGGFYSFPTCIFVLAVVLVSACAEDMPTVAAPSPRMIPEDVRQALEGSGFRGPAVVQRSPGRTGSSGVHVVRGISAAAEALSTRDATPHLNELAEAACRNDLPQDSPDLWWITVPSGGTPLRSMAHADGRLEREYYFYYYDFDLGRWIQVFDVTVRSVGAQAASCTGGHTHDAGKPTSQFAPASGRTETLFGSFTTTVTPPVAAGDERVVLTWMPNEGPLEGDTIVSEHYAANRVLGLVRLTAQGNVQLVPPTSMHNDVHYVRTGVDRLAYSLGTFFGHLDTRDVLVTAASLEFGGLNDVENNYSPPHSTHRIGTDVDLDAGDDNQATFNKLIEAGHEARFRRCVVHGGSHVHCYAYLYGGTLR